MCKILNCSIIQILIYFHLCFKPQELVVAALHDHFFIFFFVPHKKANCKCHNVLEICNFSMMTNFYTGCCALVANQQRNVGKGVIWEGLCHRKDIPLETDYLAWYQWLHKKTERICITEMVQWWICFNTVKYCITVIKYCITV